MPSALGNSRCLCVLPEADGKRCAPGNCGIWTPCISACILLGTLLLALPIQAKDPDSSESSAADQAALQEAVGWLRQKPRFHRVYNYMMTVKVRLLLFWAGQDDVGGGYVKVGEVAGDPPLQVIELLFGSDPPKAEHVNRWGAATEVLRLPQSLGNEAQSSAFFGFMKSSKGNSFGTMQKELSAEQRGGRHLFEAVLSRVDRDRAISTTLPFFSNQDYDLHQLPEAEMAVMDRLEQNQGRKFHRLEGPSQLACGRATGFLATTLTLIEKSLDGSKAPVSLCYVYNAHQYTATLESMHPMAEKKIAIHESSRPQVMQQTYRNLQDMRFQILRPDTGKRYRFGILVGTAGAERGMPIQIEYQPNWWFQVVLTLKDQSGSPAATGK